MDSSCALNRFHLVQPVPRNARSVFFLVRARNPTTQSAPITTRRAVYVRRAFQSTVVRLYTLARLRFSDRQSCDPARSSVRDDLDLAPPLQHPRPLRLHNSLSNALRPPFLARPRSSCFRPPNKGGRQAGRGCMRDVPALGERRERLCGRSGDDGRLKEAARSERRCGRSAARLDRPCV